MKSLSIAIVGGSSQIARDLIPQMLLDGYQLLVYVRDLKEMHVWLDQHGLSDACTVNCYQSYGEAPHDAVINFVGVGDPRRAAEMGASIFEVTSQFDDMVLSDLKKNPERRYIFLSSGAAYGHSFVEPVSASSEARVPINAIQPQDYYAVAKLHAEVKHRSLADLPITDLRVFNCFSRSQDLNASFFVTDIVRAIRDQTILHTNSEYMVRDFLHPSDLYQLVYSILGSPARNCAVDCYSKKPVDKPTLLKAMQQEFGLQYEVVSPSRRVAVNATGAKPHYYSTNRIAAEFGYEPAYSSLECIITETKAIFGA
jgi:nucleoside-diphosphate-sugar epimerase